LFTTNIDPQNSAHSKAYTALKQKLESEGAVVPFTLGPEAVTKKVIKALESTTPSARYYVTFPTYLLAYLKRMLPGFLLDKVLLRV
jgi:hypothetical protein